MPSAELMRLTTVDHDRDRAGLLYVYPVLSRRSGGLSVGINLNPNQACNWRCVYCQVPGLVRGSAPPIDLERLERELDGFLGEVLEGDWLERHAPPEARVLRDVAFSGDGEATSAEELPEAVARVAAVLGRRGLLGRVPVVLITNGSLVHKAHVRSALEALRAAGGVVWFKLDSATVEGRAALNDEHAGLERAEANLRLAASLCPTWVQTMMLARGGEPPSAREREAYLAFLGKLVREGVPLRGVLLYGLARPSHQPEAAELSALPREALEERAHALRALGLEVSVFA